MGGSDACRGRGVVDVIDLRVHEVSARQIDGADAAPQDVQEGSVDISVIGPGAGVTVAASRIGLTGGCAPFFFASVIGDIDVVVRAVYAGGVRPSPSGVQPAGFRVSGGGDKAIGFLRAGVWVHGERMVGGSCSRGAAGTAPCGRRARGTRRVVSAVLVGVSVGGVVVVSRGCEVRLCEQDGGDGDYSGERSACLLRPGARASWRRFGGLGSGLQRSRRRGGMRARVGSCQEFGAGRVGTRAAVCGQVQGSDVPAFRAHWCRHCARAHWCRHCARGGPSTEYHEECDRRRGGGGPRVPRGSLACRLGVVRHVGGEARQCRCSDQQAPQQGLRGLPARRQLLGWRCVWRCAQGQPRRGRRWGRRRRASRRHGGQWRRPGGRCRSRAGQVRGCSGVRGWVGWGGLARAAVSCHGG